MLTAPHRRHQRATVQVCQVPLDLRTPRLAPPPRPHRPRERRRRAPAQRAEEADGQQDSRRRAFEGGARRECDDAGAHRGRQRCHARRRGPQCRRHVDDRLPPQGDGEPGARDDARAPRARHLAHRPVDDGARHPVHCPRPEHAAADAMERLNGAPIGAQVVAQHTLCLQQRQCDELASSPPGPADGAHHVW
jgi:hypothetical protein